METIRDQIIEAAKTLDIASSQIMQAEIESIRSNLASKYIKDSDPHWRWYWDVLEQPYAVLQNSDAWAFCADYIKDCETILFFDATQEKTAFRFTNGRQVIDVLRECFSFEFYLTNQSVSYLLCFNHHDQLFAAGDAREWLQRKIDQL